MNAPPTNPNPWPPLPVPISMGDQREAWLALFKAQLEWQARVPISTPAPTKTPDEPGPGEPSH
jgi:hypothetical protein